MKRQLLSQIDAQTATDAIIASSTSALVRSAIVADCIRPERIIVAHPFNPPHLVPLVEIVGADDAVVARASAFYRALGRRPVVLNREMPGHIANRLASALYREAVHLVEQGVASVAEVDLAVTAQLGARWTACGPHEVFHLSGGERGMAAFLERLGPSVEEWWADLGAPTLDAATRAALVEGMHEASRGRSVAEMSLARDGKVVAVMAFLEGSRGGG